MSTSVAYADTDPECTYPGNRGGAFPGLPACTEGFKTEPLTCTECTRSWNPAVDERVVCADDADCVELVGTYKTCGGPISPFVVDDQDNVYFWSGRWNLHAVDKRGNLRWRFDLCNPPEDSLCGPLFPDCQPDATRMVPMVMDYHQTLYFFVGNVLYAISSEGELLLKHRVQIPGVEVPENWTFKIANGPQDHEGDYWGNTTGSPVLNEDGTLSVTYVIGGWEARDHDIPTGVLTLSRSGEILTRAEFAWREEPGYAMSAARLIKTSAGENASANLRADFPRATSESESATFSLIGGADLRWQTRFGVEDGMPGGWSVDRIQPEMAEGPNGRVYGLTQNGAVYAFDPAARAMKRIFHFYHLGDFSWQNRPIIGADGTMYFVGDRLLQGGFLWAFDTEQLWESPEVAGIHGELPDPDEHPGIKWARVYGSSGGWTTPVLSKNGRLYVGMGGVAAHDAQTGDQIWWFGQRTMGSAPTILSDGTVVVGQGITGRVFFLREDTNNGGMAEDAWPTARHDKYLSNNSRHPFRWDRSGEPPYPTVGELLANAPPCWNEADWDEAACGPLPEPERPEPDADAGGDPADVSVDPGDPDDVDIPAEDVADTTGQPDDLGNDEEHGSPGNATHGDSAGCMGCDSTGGSPDGLPVLALGALIALALRRRNTAA